MTLHDTARIPVVTEWVPLSTVGRQLGISRQHVHNLKLRFTTLHTIGEETERPFYVIHRDELELIKKNGWRSLS